MGWLSKLFGTKDIKAADAKRVSIAQLSNMIDVKLESETNQLNGEIDNFYSQIQHAADKLQERLKSLEKSQPLERVDTRLLNVAISHRKSFINQFNMMLKEFKNPIDLDFMPFLDFHNSCVFSLNETNAKSEKSFHIIVEVFKQESNEFLNEYKNMYSLLQDIGRFLKDKKGAIDPLYNARNSAKSMMASLSEVARKDADIEKMKLEIESLERKKSEIKGAIADLSSSNEQQLIVKIAKDKEQLDKEIKTCENEIIRNLSDFERGFKRLKKLVDGGLEFENENYIELYITNPIYAFQSDENQIVLMSMLNLLEKLVADGRIDFGDKDTLLETIKSAKSNTKLKELSDELENLKAKKGELYAEYEKLEMRGNKRQLESELNNIDRTINEIESNMARTTKSRNEMFEELNRIKEGLEKDVREVIKQEIAITLNQ